jgi:negative regulator of flagellin synthesis FlgM
MAMKITNHPNSRVGRSYLRPPPVVQRKGAIFRSKKLRKDEVVLSSRAAEIAKFTKLAKEIPDVRQEKIDAIKKQIADGIYNVSAESVAKSIVDLHLEINRDDKS